MGFIFALLLMGLPLAAAYVDMMQTQGATKLGGFDLPKTGGYTPRSGAAATASAPPHTTAAPPHATTEPPPAA